MLNNDFQDLALLLKDFLPFNEEIRSVHFNDRSLGRVVIMTTSYEIIFNIKTQDFITKERES